ncbi:MAG: hypothetical protein ACLFSC_06775 [Wenzhouxiangella sp.]
MDIIKQSKWALTTLVFMLGFNSGALAESTECAASDLQNVESRLVSATIQEISDLTGIDRNTLEWATATDPLFTVLVDGEAIPYHEFGPETEDELVTDSGLRIRPDTHSIAIEMQDGVVSTFDLPSLAEKKNRVFSQQASAPGDGQTEGWWFLIPPAVGVGSAVSCWAAAQMCMDDCWERIRSCPCGGSCECGLCGKASNGSCYTCPVSPPREDTIRLP